MIKLQVRFETTKSQTKIREYRDRMKSNNNTNGYTLTIVVNDGKWILAGGNHSLYAAIKEDMPYIDIVFIEAELTLDELYAFGGGEECYLVVFNKLFVEVSRSKVCIMGT